MRSVGGVDTFCWNPLRAVDEGHEPRLVNNFGDLLGPLVVELMRDDIAPGHVAPAATRRLFSVGSVMHFARKGDVVWGTGVNGKASNGSIHGDQRLDVRAVRGPWTAAFMTARGIEVPEVYGDPALLLPRLMPELETWRRVRGAEVLVVPNLNDVGSTPSGDWTTQLPTEPLRTVLRAIAGASFVVGSSLHAVVVADALGIPARLVSSPTEHLFKYRDYLAGTGRPHTTIAPSVEAAIAMGPHEPPQVDLDLLAATFPRDLWQAGSRVTRHRDRDIGTARFDAALLTRWMQAPEPGPTPSDVLRMRLEDLLAGPGDVHEEDVRAIAQEHALLAPGTDHPGIDRPLADLLAAVDRGDLEQVRVARTLAGRDPLSAELRAHRRAGTGSVLSVAVEVNQLHGGLTSLALDLVGRTSGRRSSFPVHLFPMHRRQWHLDLDVLVVPPTDQPEAWDVHVVARHETLGDLRAPLEHPGARRLGVAPGPRGTDEPRPWVLAENALATTSTED